jgi:aspartyl-tRNA(Asn)/glutamyl-tRNA(Gln) amidotransferase subunit B
LRRAVFSPQELLLPDLPKGYQISQFEIPVVQGGTVAFFVGDEKKTVRLVRAHLEEDAGKSLHEDFTAERDRPEPRRHAAAGDRHRARHALSEEAVAYAKLHKIVTWIGICDGNMQEGSFRCDANVSCASPAPLGTRREIKNLNSFKFMQQAIDYEIRWQIEQIEDGHAIQQATVLFNPDTGETRHAHQGRLGRLPLLPRPGPAAAGISEQWIEASRRMPELPRAMAERFVQHTACPPTTPPR